MNDLALNTDATTHAREWLLGRGYRLVAQGLRVGRQVVDLVVTDGPQTVLVEVVAHRERSGAVELLDRRRARLLVRAVGRYLVEHPDVPSVRIDVVTVTTNGDRWTLEHYVNAVP
jgi:Holliday junction resolvase-like predicted endonuclease